MSITVREHVPLKEFTTMKIGGTARYFTSVTSDEEVREAIQYARDKGTAVVVLGGGSNVLVTDGELDVLVIKIDIRGIEWTETKEDTVLAIVGAGENWDTFVEETTQKGYFGLENLSGIPGTVGASPIQNIGAYGVEVKDSILWLEVVDRQSGEVKRLTNAECLFGYRDSIFKHKAGKQYIVSRVAFRLSMVGQPKLEYKDLKERFKIQDSGFKNAEGKHPTSILPSKPARTCRFGTGGEGRRQPTLAEIRKAVLEIRAGKFPDLNMYGTAGSFFKNPIISQEKFDELKSVYPDLPGFEAHGTGQNEINTEPTRKVKVSLAWILDHVCNMKGYTKGHVALFERQPIVVVNTGGATAEEVTAFADSVIACVKEKMNITIEKEVREIK